MSRTAVGPEAEPRPEPDAVADAPAGTSRGLLVLAVSLVAAIAAILVGLLATRAAAPSLLFDPGPVVRWGLPVVTLIGELAAAVTIGVLALASVAFPVTKPDPVAEPAPADDADAGQDDAGQDDARPDDARQAGGRVRRPGKSMAFAPAMNLAVISSAVWTIASLVQAVLTYGQTSGTMLTDPAFGSQLAAYLTGTEPGQGLLVTTVVTAVITLVAAGSGTIGTAGFLVVLTMVALGPPALAGHSASLGGHETAVTSMGMHLFGSAVWVGGLVALLVLRSRLGDRLFPAVRVYSTLAAWSFALVAISGVLNSWTRLERLADLGSTYGLLVDLKTVALVVLGLAGYLHRRRALPDLEAGVKGTFARLAGVEIVVMAVTFGIAGAMAASAPPAELNPRLPTLAESITGYAMPPPISWGRMLTEWQPDLLWVLVAAIGGGFYLAGMVRLRARGEHWGTGLAISWFIGIAIMIYVTCGPPMTYGRVLFSAHMGAHMSLSMLTPIFLVLGAPFTLALRALSPRDDGSRGPREWLEAVLRSGTVRFLTFPPVAGFLFAGSLVFFYFSPMFKLALTTHVGHELMHVHFLLSGYLFAWVLIGLDPVPRRVSQLMRMLTLFAAMVFHSFFGVSLLSAKFLLAADFFGGLGRTWGWDLVYDQHFGAGIAWGIGDLPSMLMSVIAAVQWARSDEREARAYDAQADKDGDAELTAYNEMLARIASHDAKQAALEDRGQR